MNLKLKSCSAMRILHKIYRILVCIKLNQLGVHNVVRQANWNARRTNTLRTALAVNVLYYYLSDISSVKIMLSYRSIILFVWILDFVLILLHIAGGQTVSLHIHTAYLVWVWKETAIASMAGITLTPSFSYFRLR